MAQPDQAGMGARVLLSGALECRDAEGNVVKTITFSGSIPLSGIEAAQGEPIQSQQEIQSGN